MVFDYQEQERLATEAMQELKKLTNEELIMRGLSVALNYLSDMRKLTPEMRALIGTLDDRSHNEE